MKELNYKSNIRSNETMMYHFYLSINALLIKNLHHVTILELGDVKEGRDKESVIPYTRAFSHKGNKNDRYGAVKQS